ncbi:MAG TPA: hypothetical protein VHW24_18980, partial [Bryobacteraceae bacterium]|nr:hypothetical protein [Bryobacteraceae bacterium]
AHKQLLLFYFMHASAKPATPLKESPAWSQLFWMIEHHPEDPLVFSAVGWRLTRPVDSSLPARAVQLWNNQADRDNQPAAVYANAYLFFRLFDAPSAEKALVRLRSIDPTGDSTPQLLVGWPLRFGDFYATVLLYYATRGSVDFMTGLPSSAPGPSATYAAQVAKTLQQSTDVRTILLAANHLVGMTLPDSKRFGDVDPLAFGQQLIQRALTLQPNSAWAHQLQNVAADRQLIGTIPGAVWQGTFDSRHAAIESLPTGDRFRELAILAMAAADRGVRAQVQFHVPAAEQDAWSKAGVYAREALDLAPQATNEPDYGTAFFNANMILGMVAVRSGDTKTAVGYLRKAATAPVTPALRYPISNARPWLNNWRFPDMLMTALLKAGQKDAVLDFLERYAKINVEYRTRYLESIALIRQGKTPSWARS